MGHSDGTFRPDDTITRAQLAAVLQRMNTSAIIDVVDMLPRHSTKPVPTRPLSAVNMFILHHSGTPGGDPWTFADYHIKWKSAKDTGWFGIGYSYVIMPNGTIYQTQYLTTRAYHAGNANTAGIGVCLVGDRGPTRYQWDAAKWLYRHLRPMFPVLDIFGHRGPDRALYVDVKSISSRDEPFCPGSGFDLAKFRKEV